MTARLLRRDAGVGPNPQRQARRGYRRIRHGDGGLALFNGAWEGDRGLTDLVLARSGSGEAAPAVALVSGFQRLAAGTSLVIADSGSPPISNKIMPGLMTAAQYSGSPLPLPMRVSAWIAVIDLCGKTRI